MKSAKSENSGKSPDGSSSTLSVLPNCSLEMVPLAAVVIHEEHDPTRAQPLTEAIYRDKVQHHPVILARDTHGAGAFVHLDGANRVTALKNLKCRHVAAQMVTTDSNTVGLTTWGHLISLHGIEDMLLSEQWRSGHLHQISGEKATELLATWQAAAVIFTTTGFTFALSSSKSLTERMDAWRQLAALYAGPDRVALEQHALVPCVYDLLTRHPHANACVVYAIPSLDEVLTLALRMQLKIPAGVTHFDLKCGRVLFIDAPLSLLQSDMPTEDKTVCLHQLLTARRWRGYEEPTFIYE